MQEQRREGVPLPSDIVCFSVAFLGGVALGLRFSLPVAHVWLFALPGALLVPLVVGWVLREPKLVFWSKGLVVLFFLLVGWMRAATLRPYDTAHWGEGEWHECVAVCTEVLDTTEWGLRQRATIVALRDSAVWRPDGVGVWLLYDQRDTALPTLLPNDTLLLRGRRVATNREEVFLNSVLASWEARSGVAFRVRVARGGVRLLAQGNPGRQRPFMQLREAMLRHYRAVGLQGVAYSTVAAMTIGERKSLSRQQRDEFASTGIAHILALSGLHAGFVYALFLVLCYPLLLYNPATRALRYFLPLLLVWAFAATAGFSASLLRAVLMITAYALARYWHMPITIIDSLLLAAMIILFIAPAALFDVGFLLSFGALYGIIAFTSPFYRLYRPRTQVGLFFWGLLAVNVGAQLGTLPVLLYCFGTLPLVGQLANLFAVPLATIIVPLGLFLSILPAGFLLTDWVARLLSWIVSLLVSSNAWVSHLPFAQLNGLRLPACEVVLLAVAIILLAVYTAWHRRLYGYFALGALCAFMVLLGIRTLRTYREIEVVALHNTNGLQLVFRDGGNLYNWESHPGIWGQYKLRDYGANVPARMLEPAKPFAFSHGALRGATIGSFAFYGLAVRVLTVDTLAVAEEFTPADTADITLLGFRPRIPLQELFAKLPTRIVVLGASMPWWHRKAIREECKGCGIQAYTTSSSTMLRWRLKEGKWLSE